VIVSDSSRVAAPLGRLRRRRRLRSVPRPHLRRPSSSLASPVRRIRWMSKTGRHKIPNSRASRNIGSRERARV